jgi:uncharacterized Zn finger protein (UPF0148 family)
LIDVEFKCPECGSDLVDTTAGYFCPVHGRIDQVNRREVKYIAATTTNPNGDYIFWAQQAWAQNELARMKRESENKTAQTVEKPIPPKPPEVKKRRGSLIEL